jgi:hypothetical protein
VDPKVDPVANRELHAKAERAALEAYLAATATTPARRVKLMDRAAKKVLLDAGTPRDTASFFCEIVSALVLERLHHTKKA